VRDAFVEETDFLTKPDHRNLLETIKTHAVVEAYLRGEATPDDVRPFLECEQCRSIVQLCREILPRLAAEKNQITKQSSRQFRSDSIPVKRFSFNNLTGKLLSGNQLRPAAVGLVSGLLIVSLTLGFLLLWSPSSQAIWRYGKEPLPIANKKGSFSSSVEEITNFGKTGK
jgi:hypothetical protein